MQDVTDLPFMRLMHHFGAPDVFVTEYFRVHPDSTLRPWIVRSITENPSERPIFAQMIGQSIPDLVRTAKELCELPIAGVDLNLGCPAPVVCRKDAGGGLLRNPHKVREILAALREAVPTRLTVKTRIGFYEPDEWDILLDVFSSCEIDALTIHGRTVKERYSTPVHTGPVRRAVERLSCPVVANGNIVDAETAKGYHAETGAAGLMVGRGAIRNPWIFEQLRQAFLGQNVRVVRRKDVLGYVELLYEETARLQMNYEPNKHVTRLKKYMKYISQGTDDDFLKEVQRMQTPEDFFASCRRHLDSDEVVPSLPPEGTKLFCGFRELLPCK